MRTYLDHNATSPLRPSVKAAMLTAMDKGGNASSVHAEGRAARKLIDDARQTLGFALGCLPEMIIFTSGGTEANNMALRGVDVERILVPATEHPSVLEAAKASGTKVEIIPVDGHGIVDLKALEKMIIGQKVLVSVMAVNNETGVIQPLHEIAAITSKAGALFHVDAVQAFKKTLTNFGLIGCDLMTVCAHKAGGPTGIGALIVRDGLPIEPLLLGGGQELRRRAGTENIAAIAGFAALAREPQLDLSPLQRKLEAALPGAIIFGQGAPRVSNTTCFAIPSLSAESLLMNYDLDGIAVSSGSACSSGKVQQSHVLKAMGVAPDLAKGAIRVSLGWNTTEQDIEHFVAVTHKLVARAKAKAA
ncbi:cysteine desulfurase family protein [Aestuariivirga litoralis]|uniref:cysteine desulfurase family protein n=1 Tax=Aestuariivirga litoralis TaxID=2650924 RepID=UPI0018C835CE|nr:cysteine desulfurase family protein [Aestuariivirga litoralis]MBG1231897.1 cysteine desulfurase [Aestuariivirga litoralis]